MLTRVISLTIPASHGGGDRVYTVVNLQVL
jgi:hypothetical protein